MEFNIPQKLGPVLISRYGTYEHWLYGMTAWVELSWTMPTDNSRDHVKVSTRHKELTALWQTIVESIGTKVRIDDLTYPAQHYFRITPVNHFDEPGPFTTISIKFGPDGIPTVIEEKREEGGDSL